MLVLVLGEGRKQGHPPIGVRCAWECGARFV